VSIYQQYKDWAWEVPTAEGRTDRVDLTLDLFGHEILRLNGAEVMNVRRFKFVSEHRLTLSNGVDVTIRVRAEWRNLGLPKCELLLAGESIPPVVGPTIEPVLPSDLQPPSLTPIKRAAVLVRETYRWLFLVSLLFFFGYVIPQKVGQAGLPLWIFYLFFAAAAIKAFLARFKAIHSAKRSGTPLADAIYKEDFLTAKRRELKRQPSWDAWLSIRGKFRAAPWVIGFIFGVLFLSLGSVHRIMPHLPAAHAQVFEVIGWIIVLTWPINAIESWLYD